MALGAKEGCLPLGSWGKLLGGGDTQGLENVKDSLGELWAEKAACMGETQKWKRAMFQHMGER